MSCVTTLSTSSSSHRLNSSVNRNTEFVEVTDVSVLCWTGGTAEARQFVWTAYHSSFSVLLLHCGSAHIATTGTVYK